MSTDCEPRGSCLLRDPLAHRRAGLRRHKENRGFRRFMRRGLSAAESETALIFAAHNLLKVFHHNPSAVLPAT